MAISEKGETGTMAHAPHPPAADQSNDLPHSFRYAPRRFSSTVALLFFVAILLFFSPQTAAEIFYIWTDGRDIVNMTNDPSMVPFDLRRQRGIALLTAGGSLQRPNPDWAVSAEPVRHPVAGSADPAGKTGSESARLEKTVESLENRNQSLHALQEMLRQLVNGQPENTR